MSRIAHLAAFGLTIQATIWVFSFVLKQQAPPTKRASWEDLQLRPEVGLCVDLSSAFNRCNSVSMAGAGRFGDARIAAVHLQPAFSVNRQFISSRTTGDDTLGICQLLVPLKTQ